jgi:hypothetical protein
MEGPIQQHIFARRGDINANIASPDFYALPVLAHTPGGMDCGGIA